MRMQMAGAAAMVVLAAVGGAGPATVIAQGSQQATARFVANGAEVTDTLTGLIWRRCSEGQSWTGSDCAGSASALTWQQALDLAKSAAAGGVPWRLPNVKELGSLVDDSRFNPAIDTSVFPGTPSSSSAAFWSSSPSAGHTNQVWIVYFQSGIVAAGVRRNFRELVRLVRDGQ